jgi:serine/threonine protein kinase
MPVFFALPDGVKQKLTEYFADKLPGTKIKYGFSLRGMPVEVEPSGDYVLKNSYIKLNKGIYALGRGDKATIGSGAFGTVKYIRSLSTNNTYVVKIIRYGSSEKELESISKEVLAAYDLGLYRDEGSRKHSLEYKQYLVMMNAGTPLDKYIARYPALDQGTRFDLAIKLCWTIHDFHRGMASRTGTPYAHRDIKPANIAIDRTGRMRLVDLGIVTPNPETVPTDFAGAPAYLPNYATLLHDSINLREYDILALKRTLYMPGKILCVAGYKVDTSASPFGCRMIFPKTLVQDANLIKVIDTSSTPKENVLRKEYYQTNALLLASLLVLTRYSLMEGYAAKMCHPTLAYAVLGIYFANTDLSDKEMAELINDSIRAYLLVRVVARHQERANQVKLISYLVAEGVTYHLKEAMGHDVLLDLLASPNQEVRRAAVLLWQNGVQKPELLIRLTDNEVLAKQVTQSIFDGELSVINELLAKPLALTIKKPIETARIILPAIGVVAKVEEMKPECKSARSPSKKGSEAATIKRDNLPFLFFAPHKEKRATERKGTPAIHQPWR